MHPSRWKGETRWFTHVLVNEAAQGKRSTCKPVQLPLFKSHLSDRVKVPIYCFIRAGRLQEDYGSKSTSAQRGQGLAPDVDEVAAPNSVVSSMRRPAGCPTICKCKCLLYAQCGDLCFARHRHKGQRVRDWRANVNSEENAQRILRDPSIYIEHVPSGIH